ncbi:hypothetical protein B0H10DRAFT_1952807 [Mycena sp. CBHHK59/15]|nr:hypothetical protein B0H10DRAFT_1952807 [Mycena sp. CBHHK59/15]
MYQTETPQEGIRLSALDVSSVSHHSAHSEQGHDGPGFSAGMGPLLCVRRQQNEYGWRQHEHAQVKNLTRKATLQLSTLARKHGLTSAGNDEQGTSEARIPMKVLWMRRQVVAEEVQNGQQDRQASGNVFKNKCVLMEYIHREKAKKSCMKVLTNQMEAHRVKNKGVCECCAAHGQGKRREFLDLEQLQHTPANPLAKFTPLITKVQLLHLLIRNLMVLQNHVKLGWITVKD